MAEICNWLPRLQRSSAYQMLTKEVLEGEERLG